MNPSLPVGEPVYRGELWGSGTQVEIPVLSILLLSRSIPYGTLVHVDVNWEAPPGRVLGECDKVYSIVPAHGHRGYWAVLLREPLEGICAAIHQAETDTV